MFIAGIFLMTFGIALSCKAGMGTTPISSVPFVLSMFTGYTIGELTVAMNLLFIVPQPFLVRDLPKKVIIGQASTLIIFGPSVDLWMYLLRWLNPTHIGEMWGACILSSFILAFGVFLCIKAKIFTAPGEGLVLAVEKVLNFKFALLKNCFDIGLVSISVIISYAVFGELHGVGAGTVASAILVGRIIRTYEKRIKIAC